MYFKDINLEIITIKYSFLIVPWPYSFTEEHGLIWFCFPNLYFIDIPIFLKKYIKKYLTNLKKNTKIKNVNTYIKMCSILKRRDSYEIL